MMRQIRVSRMATLALGVGLAALAAAAGLMIPLSAAPPAQSAAPSGPTPQLANGKPDLSGMWDGRGGRSGDDGGGFTNRVEGDGDISRLFPSRRCAPNQQGCRDNTNQANDYEFTSRINPDRPMYRPEHWDRVQFLDYDTNFSDPMFRCEPLGIPRIGAPRKIMMSPAEVVFFYGPAGFQTSNSRDYRIIKIGGQHNPDAFPSYFGDSIASWDGDTLVIDAIGFNDTTWLSGRGGYFHSFDLHVTERLRRDGDILRYTVTIEDPSVLLQPWVLTRQLRLNPDPNATIQEGLPCREIDSEITVSRIRH